MNTGTQYTNTLTQKTKMRVIDFSSRTSTPGGVQGSTTPRPRLRGKQGHARPEGQAAPPDFPAPRRAPRVGRGAKCPTVRESRRGTTPSLAPEPSRASSLFPTPSRSRVHLVLRAQDRQPGRQLLCRGQHQAHDSLNIIGDALGLNSTGGPLGFRMSAFAVTWYNMLMPGAVQPHRPGVSAKRKIWQSVGYAAYIYFLVQALPPTALAFGDVAPIAATLAVLTPFDLVTFFQAASTRVTCWSASYSRGNDPSASASARPLVVLRRHRQSGSVDEVRQRIHDAQLEVARRHRTVRSTHLRHALHGPPRSTEIAR